MKIYRALRPEEECALLEHNSIYKKGKTCRRPDWLLFEHPEDYETGKFFFFTMEDVVTYALFADGYSKDSTILEIDIDENSAFEYLGYGKYCYGDWDSCGDWDYQCTHCIPEVFLPYRIVQEELDGKRFRTISYEERKHITTLKNKQRPQEIINLGNLVAKITCNKDYIKHYQKQLEGDFDTSYYRERIQALNVELQNAQNKLKTTYNDFVRRMNNYSWSSSTEVHTM